MTTVPFLPQLGGMETVVALLAREFVKLGCEVKVATLTPSSERDLFPYEVIREPGRGELWRLYQWADVYLQHGPSLKLGWPVFFGHKPAAIVHHIWMAKTDGGISNPNGWLRLSLLKHCRNLAVSQAMGKSLPVPWEAVPNLYDDELFRLMPEVARDRDLVFLGRLEDFKGVDDLIEALGILKTRKFEPKLTVIGDGSAREKLKGRTRDLGLAEAVEFAGELRPGNELTSLLNRHKIMVVPSRWQEPFGLIALEGIACGCAVIGSSGGGLPEAIGSCGVTFPNGDTVVLADKIEIFLKQPELRAKCLRNTASHLARHTPLAIAQQYLKMLGMANFDNSRMSNKG